MMTCPLFTSLTVALGLAGTFDRLPLQLLSIAISILLKRLQLVQHVLQVALVEQTAACCRGHATIGTAAMRTAELALGLPGGFEFEMVSDMYNGINQDNAEDDPRPLRPRPLTVTEAVEQNQEGRLFIGALSRGLVGLSRICMWPRPARRCSAFSPLQACQMEARYFLSGVLSFHSAVPQSASHGFGALHVRAWCRISF